MLYGGVNGDLLQEGLCHTQVCCTQSPCPCGSPLLTCTTTGETQTQFCLSLCGVSGSWCAQGLFEPPERLWWEWSLILNSNLPLLPSCWGFSLAFGRGVSPQSFSGAAQLPLQCLPSCQGFSFAPGHGVFPHSHFSAMQPEPDILECEVKCALGSITTNKASGGDGIPVELFQILKDAAAKVLHSICQRIWKTQQWPQD